MALTLSFCEKNWNGMIWPSLLRNPVPSHEFGVHHSWYLRRVYGEPFIIPPVHLLVLLKVLLIKDELEHAGSSGLWLFRKHFDWNSRFSLVLPNMKYPILIMYVIFSWTTRLTVDISNCSTVALIIFLMLWLMISWTWWTASEQLECFFFLTINDTSLSETSTVPNFEHQGTGHF